MDRALGRIAAASADGHSIHVQRLDEVRPGWIELDRLLATDDLKAALLARVTGISGPPADHIKAEWTLESLARALADLAGASLVGEKCLPLLEADNLLVATQNGLVAAVAVRTNEMSRLAADGKAAGSAAGALEDWRELADLMHAGLAGLLAPVIAWIDGHGLRPEKTLWQAAGDCIAQSLVWSGKAFGERDFALEVTEYLMGLGGPMAVPVRRDFDEVGEPFHVRATCCLVYRTPEGGLCRACPLNRTA